MLAEMYSFYSIDIYSGSGGRGKRVSTQPAIQDVVVSEVQAWIGENPA